MDTTLLWLSVYTMLALLLLFGAVLSASPYKGKIFLFGRSSAVADNEKSGDEGGMAANFSSAPQQKHAPALYSPSDLDDIALRLINLEQRLEKALAEVEKQKKLNNQLAKVAKDAIFEAKAAKEDLTEHLGNLKAIAKKEIHKDAEEQMNAIIQFCEQKETEIVNTMKASIGKAG